MKLSWATVPVTDDVVAKAMGPSRYVMLDEQSRARGGRKHLTPQRAADGKWHVRLGRRGSCSACFLTECKITYLDGEAILHQFKLGHG